MTCRPWVDTLKTDYTLVSQYRGLWVGFTDLGDNFSVVRASDVNLIR